MGGAKFSGFEIRCVYEYIGYWKSWMDSTSRGRKIYCSGRRENGVIIISDCSVGILDCENLLLVFFLFNK
jgi:hypothetical protein